SVYLEKAILSLIFDKLAALPVSNKAESGPLRPLAARHAPRRLVTNRHDRPWPSSVLSIDVLPDPFDRGFGGQPVRFGLGNQPRQFGAPLQRFGERRAAAAERLRRGQLAVERLLLGGEPGRRRFGM